MKTCSTIVAYLLKGVTLEEATNLSSEAFLLRQALPCSPHIKKAVKARLAST